METVEQSQNPNPQSPEDPSLSASTPVTAAGTTPADTATPPQQEVSQSAPPAEAPAGGQTGEGVGLEDDSLEAYERDKQQFLASAPPPPVSPPPAAAVPAPPAAAPAPAGTPPAAQPPENPNAPPPPVAALPREDEIPALGEDGKIPQIKMRFEDQRDFQLAAEFKTSQRAGYKGSFAEFIVSRVPAPQPPAQTPPPAAATGEPGTPAATPVPPAPPQNVAEVDQRLTELRKQRYEHLNNFAFDEAQEVEEQELQLQGLRVQLAQQEVQNQQSAQQRWQIEETRYAEQAARMFPESVSTESAISQKAGEILGEWERNGDPRAKHPSRILTVYVEAGMQLGIAPTPVAPGAPPPPASHPQSQPTPPPVNRHAPPLSAIIAGGDARTTQPAARPLDIDAITSVEDYERAKSTVLATPRR